VGWKLQRAGDCKSVSGKTFQVEFLSHFTPSSSFQIRLDSFYTKMGYNRIYFNIGFKSIDIKSRHLMVLSGMMDGKSRNMMRRSNNWYAF